MQATKAVMSQGSKSKSNVGSSGSSSLSLQYLLFFFFECELHDLAFDLAFDAFLLLPLPAFFSAEPDFFDEPDSFGEPDFFDEPDSFGEPDFFDEPDSCELSFFELDLCELSFFELDLCELSFFELDLCELSFFELDSDDPPIPGTTPIVCSSLVFVVAIAAAAEVAVLTLV